MIIKITPMGAVRSTQKGYWKPNVRRYQAWKDELRLLARHYKPESGLSLTFIMPMAESWSKKKKAQMLGMPHAQKPDLDNLLKAFLDALLDDDSTIHTFGEMKKIWGPEGQIVVHE